MSGSNGRSTAKWAALGIGMLMAMLVLTVGSRRLIAEEEQAAAPQAPAASSNRSTRAAHAGGGASSSKSTGTSAKLDKIIEHQEQILAKLDDVLKELQIVKIRATR